MSVRIFSAIMLISLYACSRIDLFEKVVFTPKQEWEQSFQPDFTFDIQDTVSRYKVFFIIRHADAYAYNNIWIKLTSKLPGDKTIRNERFDIQLASEKRWLGSGMDDLYDHRVLLYRDPVQFNKPGRYTLRVAQEMRVDPLDYIFNVGIRLEKVK